MTAARRLGGSAARRLVMLMTLLTALPHYRLTASIQCPDGSAPPCRTAAPTRAPSIDPNRIAILPFRVTGVDTTLAEGMAELLATEFTGEGGPRAVDPATMWRAWRRAGGGPRQPLAQDVALRVAREVGAGQLLTGSVVGLGDRVTLSAIVFQLPGGGVRVRATPVSGPADSLSGLLRSLTTGLLASGGTAREVGTTSPEALREYLVGLALYRRGVWVEAYAHLERAVTADSNFAAAAVALLAAAQWGSPSASLRDRAMHLAWSHRTRLSARDRLMVEAYLGPRWPEPSSIAEGLAVQERFAEAFPSNPEAWYLLGDTYFHFGRALGYGDARDRAASAFHQALALDSTYGGPLQHLMELAGERGDSVAARSFHRRLTAGGGGDVSTETRWLMMFARRDRAAVERELASPGAADFAGFYFTQLAWDAFGIAYADRALARRDQAALTEQRRAQAREFRVVLELNRGRPQAARTARLSGPARGPVLARIGWFGSVVGLDVVAALFASGDRGLAEGTIGLAEQLSAAPLAGDADGRHRQYEASCLEGLWRGWHGDVVAADRAIERLRTASIPRDSAWIVVEAGTCKTALEALVAVRSARAEADAALARLDSLGRAHPDPGFGVHWEAQLLARLLAERGEHARALEVVGRRDYFMLPIPTLLTGSLREECRLAALLGERDIGRKACRWYLDLVTDPEPAMVPQRDSVRAELARLEGR